MKFKFKKSFLQFLNLILKKLVIYTKNNKQKYALKYQISRSPNISSLFSAFLARIFCCASCSFCFCLFLSAKVMTAG